MKKQFTCPVSMAVTEEQFNNDLRQPLIDLGYEIDFGCSFTCNEYIVNNIFDELGKVDNVSDWYLEYNRHFIESYNPQLFLALASLTTESTETKEEVLARFEKGEERELIGYRFRNDDFNKMTYALVCGIYGVYSKLENNTDFPTNCMISVALTELNLLDTFCEPVYKEATISIEEAETILRSIGRTEKIKA